MDLDEYHKAWQLGFSESECTRMAEEKWEKNQMQNTSLEEQYRRHEAELYAAMQEEFNAHMEREHEQEIWGERFVKPIADEMQRRGVKEMHICIRDGKASFDLVPVAAKQRRIHDILKSRWPI